MLSEEPLRRKFPHVVSLSKSVCKWDFSVSKRNEEKIGGKGPDPRHSRHAGETLTNNAPIYRFEARSSEATEGWPLQPLLRADARLLRPEHNRGWRSCGSDSWERSNRVRQYQCPDGDQN